MNRMSMEQCGFGWWLWVLCEGKGEHWLMKIQPTGLVHVRKVQMVFFLLEVVLFFQ
jgi:hypothetical protein